MPHNVTIVAGKRAFLQSNYGCNIKQSIAGAKQEIVASVVWVGSRQINVMQLMLETLVVVKELAELTASHTVVVNKNWSLA
ncbi:hypothetical protein [Photorhabdus heterorhabditis]|uniref:hypothetical protein n=1 Tax=Photorhabdus heterorhabditis TaxID=880156 RepID=UPI001C280A9A|nr:hypothetical protein [Photorhabdus heterorhabditis]